jgi:Transcriptional regulators
MGRRPTQNDVAKAAGVSRATVSYVLNLNESSRVPISQETRERVLKAMEELGYEPDVRAQMLRSGKTKTIGILVPDMQNPHYWQYLSGVEEEAHRTGYALLIYHSALNRDEEGAGLRALASRRVDGLIVLSAFTRFSEVEIRELADSRLPVVDFSPTESPFDCIAANYREAARVLMRHLFDLGHERIALVYGVPDFDIGRDRLEPYLEGLRAAGVKEEKELVATCGTSIEDGYHAALGLLDIKPRPTAIVAVNDLLALGVLRAAADRGLSVPRDISVAGFDDISFAQFATPRLTTVHRETEEAGRKAFQILVERMENPNAPRRVEPIDSSLVERESTGPAPRH